MIKILISIILLYCTSFAQNDINLTQNSGNGSFVDLLQKGDNNNLISNQTAEEGKSELISVQEFPSIMNEVYIDQYAKGTNIAHINQYYGTINKIDATQISSNYDNLLNVSQEYGSHTLQLNQSSTSGSNITNVSQINGSGYADIIQTGYLNNTIPDAGNSLISPLTGNTGIYQNGNNNYIVGADVSSSTLTPIMIQYSTPAQQISLLGNNWLEIWQTGDNNTVGLYQKSTFDNTALIKQENGNNTLAVYQSNIGGSNYLYVEQAGNMTAQVYQKSVSGSFNKAIIIQK